MPKSTNSIQTSSLKRVVSRFSFLLRDSPPLQRWSRTRMGSCQGLPLRSDNKALVKYLRGYLRTLTLQISPSAPYLVKSWMRLSYTGSRTRTKIRRSHGPILASGTRPLSSINGQSWAFSVTCALFSGLYFTSCHPSSLSRRLSSSLDWGAHFTGSASPDTSPTPTSTVSSQELSLSPSRWIARSCLE